MPPSVIEVQLIRTHGMRLRRPRDAFTSASIVQWFRVQLTDPPIPSARPPSHFFHGENP